VNDRYKIDKLNAVPEERYSSIALDYLVMYVVGQLDKVGADLSYENIVAASFRSFPKRFSLIGFSEYPDAKRVHDCLFRCTIKPKFWLGGKTNRGFSLNENSSEVIAKAEALIAGEPQPRLKSGRKQRRKEMIASEIEASAAFSKYKQGHEDQISESDIAFLLGGTLDSSRSLLRDNMEHAIAYTRELSRDDLVAFLDAMAQRFRSFLRRPL